MSDKIIPYDTLLELLADDSPRFDAAAKLNLTYEKYEIPPGETPLDRVRKALTLCEDLEDDNFTVYLRPKDAKLDVDFVDHDLLELHPTLAVSATLEETLAAIKQLKSEYLKCLQSKKESRVYYVNKRLNIGMQLLSVYNCLEDEIDDECESYDEICDFLDGYSIGDRKTELRESMEDMARKVQPYINCMSDIADGILENHVRGFMKEHGLKDSLDAKSTKHLDLESDHPDLVVMKGKRGSNGACDIPLEIAAMVYSYCDLESFVQLRQVSTCWYNAFQQTDSTLEAVVKNRFPWMRLEGELMTWRDCALVFVQRVRNKEWTTELDLKGISSSSAKVTLARRLEYEDVLDGAFTPLHSHTEGSCSGPCSMVHLGTTPDSLILIDPWCADYETSEDESWILFSTGSAGNIIKYRGVEISLPPGVKPRPHRARTTDDNPSPVSMTKHHIFVHTPNDLTYVFPRDNPRHATLVHGKHCASFELGNILVLRNEPLGSRDRVYYDFQDLLKGARVVLDYEVLSTSHPVAYYEGLVWWQMNHGVLVPTCIDTSNPQKMYFRPSKAIAVAKDPLHPFVQCNNAPQFVVREFERGLELVDLRTGSITQVENQQTRPNREGRIFLGLKEGKFQAWFMDEISISRYTENAQNTVGFHMTELRERKTEIESDDSDDSDEGW